MKALPQKFTERWVQARADADGKVRFLIRPLDNRVRSHIQSQTVTYEKTDECDKCGTPQYKRIVDGAAAAYDTVGFGLIAIEGMVEENGCAFILDTKQVKLGSKSMARVTDASIDRLPALLFEEIMAEINISSTMSEEEIESLKNTLDSPSPVSTDAEIVMETSQTVFTGVVTED